MGIAYSIRYHPRVSKDLSILSQTMKERVKKAIELKLLNRPEIFGIPLQEALRGHRKLRVGDLRIVFQIEPNTIYILAVLHRSFVYCVCTACNQGGFIVSVEYSDPPPF